MLLSGLVFLAQKVEAASGWVSLNANEYYPGNTIIVTASGSGNYYDDTWQIRLKDPSGTTKASDSLGFSETYDGQISYVVQASDRSGLWIATISLYSPVTHQTTQFGSDSAVVYAAQVDTDADGLSDTYEIYTYYESIDPGLYHYTSPTDPDTDDDGLSDGQEVLTYGSNPLKDDTDGDTWNDYDEVIYKKTSPSKIDTDSDGVQDNLDTDPLTNLQITVEVLKVNQLAKVDNQNLGDGDFWCLISAGGGSYLATWRSYENGFPIQTNTGQLSPSWRAVFDVPDNAYEYSLTIILYDRSGSGTSTTDRICDTTSLSGVSNFLSTYNLSTGEWTGDDLSNGRGHISGKEGFTVSSSQRDCELWFWVSQNDFDSDGLTYWEELNSYGTDPSRTTYTDADGDGLTNDLEYTARSKSDNKDSDSDGINDCYEWNCMRLSPITQGDDSVGFITFMKNHYVNETKSLKNYSKYLSYEFYASYLWGVDVGLKKFLENDAVKRDSKRYELDYAGLVLELEAAAVKSALIPPATGAFVLEAVVTWAGQEILRNIATQAWSGWNDVQTQWNGITTSGSQVSQVPPITLDGIPPGFICQIGYALNKDPNAGKEVLSDRLAEISRQYAGMAVMLNSWVTFDGALTMAYDALRQYGPIYDCIALGFTSPRYLSVTKSDGSRVQMTAIDPNDYRFRYLSEVELWVYSLGKNLNAYLDDARLVPFMGSGTMTVGDVASDLTNFAYNTLLWLKKERELLCSFLQPCPVMPAAKQTGQLKVVTSPSADVKIFVNGLYLGDWTLDRVPIIPGSWPVEFKKGTTSVKLPGLTRVTISWNILTTLTVDTKLGKTSVASSPI